MEHRQKELIRFQPNGETEQDTGRLTERGGNEEAMADSPNLEGAAISGIDWYTDMKSRVAMPDMKSATRLHEQAQEAAQAAYEQDWEWRDRQTELLNQIVEEQHALAKGSEKSYKAALWAAVFAGISVFATILITVLPIIFSRFGQ